MNIHRIEGNIQTKGLVKNIINDFKTYSCPQKHIDYSLSIGKNKFLTNKQDNKFRNVSIIYTKGINAAIGNETGNIIINKKPLFCTLNRAYKNILKFLNQIQPENINNNKIVENVANESNYKKIIESGNQIKKTITGSNSTWTKEIFENYKNL